jgi:hypothetical protein
MEDQVAEEGPRSSRLGGRQRLVAEIDGELTEQPDPQRPLVDAGDPDLVWRRWCPHEMQFRTGGCNGGTLDSGAVAGPRRTMTAAIEQAAVVASTALPMTCP